MNETKLVPNAIKTLRRFAETRGLTIRVTNAVDGWSGVRNPHSIEATRKDRYGRPQTVAQVSFRGSQRPCRPLSKLQAVFVMTDVVEGFPHPSNLKG